MKILTFLALVIVTALLQMSCTWHNAEDLFAKDDGCDTTAVSYNNHIAPIMASSCNSCHSAGAFKTSDYAGLKATIESGRLEGSVYHLPGYKPMPSGQPQLDSCSLKRITAWINQGYLNN